MNYKVLYRKYRPTDFNSVVSQKNTIELLKDSIINDKISHAYIFSGPRGTGKTSTAKIFAKAINCTNNTDGNPCGKCNNCINFAQSSDVYEIDAASNNGVDQIREIIDNVKLAPINSKYKVYIIDEVHMLSTSAFNALLLTLEEPPSHVVFILATTDIEDVPITVLSRCQRLDFKKIPDSDLIEHLKYVSKEEKIEIDEDAIKEIALYADGGLRDALSILDQLSKLEGTISHETVLKTIGLVSNKSIDDLLNSIENNDTEYITSFIKNVSDCASDFKLLIKKLIDNIKNRIISLINDKGSYKLSIADYKDLSFELAALIYKNNVNVNSYDLLELLLLSYIDLSVIRPQEIVKEQVVETREEPKVEEKIDPPAEKKDDKIISQSSYCDSLQKIRVNNCFVSANKTYLNSAKENWGEFIKSIKLKKIKGLLLDTDVVLASDEIIVLKTALEDQAELINKSLADVEKLFNEEFQTSIKIIAVNAEYWNNTMDEYKNNIKNNIKYNYISEDGIDVSDTFDDIFNSQKIEVK